jgi:adenylylsulfate kinase
MDTRKRTLTKALSWKLITFISLALIVFIKTGSLQQAVGYSLIYQVYTFFMFNVHERVWNMFRWGKKKGLMIQMTGLSGAGKSTIAQEAAIILRKKGYKVELIDGDYYRQHLCKDLGFSKADRNENIRRLGFVGNVLSNNGVICILAAINPYEEVRKEIRSMGNYVKTVFVKADITTAIDRDPKGLYKKALLPDDHPDKIPNFTGISDPFESPLVCDLTLNTDKESERQSANKLVKFVLKNT